MTSIDIDLGGPAGPAAAPRDPDFDEALRAVIEAFRLADEWDQAPTLIPMFRDQDGDLAGMLGVFPEFIWSNSHPRDVLRTLTATIGDIGRPPLPAELELVGLMLVSEAYGVVADERPIEHWDTHRIADDPAGYEFVSAIAVDVAGNTYGHDYRRHAEQSHAHQHTQGALVDALRGLLTALTAPARGDGS